MENKKIINAKIILDFMQKRMTEIAFKGMDHIKECMEFDSKVDHYPKTQEEVEKFLDLQQEQKYIEGQMEAYQTIFDFLTTLPLRDTTTHEA